ncbi:MAG: ABC transporter permease subunit [Lachnospiraceae bacterium]|nr:ABC transporter permease subunit [Lachnospiraceae bacterium]
MRTVFLKELKLNIKNLLIWSLTIGLLGLACIVIYKSMQADMKNMADAFSNMGAFADAFGMSTLSIATLKGYFATEIGTIHGLGGGLFAAIIAIGMLSKEEEAHTGEFLFSLPLSRSKVVLAKCVCIAVMLVVFTVICAALYALGFVALGEGIPAKEFLTFMGMQLVMDIEIAAICFFVSALSGKNKMGLGLGIALICYMFDLIGRVVPDLKEYLFLGPYSFSNASEIFSGADISSKALIVAAAVTVLCIAGAFICYNRRDLAS